MSKNSFYQATESFLFSYGQVESYIEDLNEKILSTYQERING